MSREDPTKCEKCGCEKLTREEDVLDTWFSSALWPFSTLGWPDKNPDLDYFYPTSVMVTGYDIIFFWVARMIFSGMEQMKKQPFDKVLIHGIVRDSLGRKMSKSLGNGIDPLEIADKWILSKLNTLAKEVTENLDSYELGVAAQKIYDFIWDSFCDWYIELSKARLSAGDEDVQRVLLYVLTEVLKLLHPFMPFITEEIYQAIPHTGEALIIEKYPEYVESLDFSREETEFEIVIDAISAIRSRRSEMNVPPSRKAKVYVSTEHAEIFESAKAYITRLASASDVEVKTMGGDNETKGMVTVITHSARIAMPMAELVDLSAERDRISRELKKNRGFLEAQEKKLSNESFVSRAPEAVVNAEREKAEKLKALIENLEKTLAGLE